MKITHTFKSLLITCMLTELGIAAHAQREDIPIDKKHFKFYKDSLLYLSPKLMPGNADGIVLRSSFKMHLPRQLNGALSDSETHTVFFFGDGQLILVESEVGYPMLPDTVYTPDKIDLLLWFGRINGLQGSKLHEQIPERKTMLYRKSKWKILLMNIKVADFDRFLDAVNSFRVVKYNEWKKLD